MRPPATFSVTSVSLTGAGVVKVLEADPKIRRVMIKTRSNVGWISHTNSPSPRAAGWFVTASTTVTAVIEAPKSDIYAQTNADADTTVFILLVERSA